MPDSLAELLPGALPRGTVAVLSGARSLPLSMVAAVTAEGGHAAIVGQPDVGLLAAVEMGADLSRIAVIPDPGCRSGRGGRGADGRHGSGGARPGRPVGAGHPGPGGGGAGPAEGVHAAGHRRRLAGGIRPAGCQGQRLRDRRCRPRSADRPGAGGSAGCGWPCAPRGRSPAPPVRVAAEVASSCLAGAGDLVHGLARGRRGRRGRPASNRAGRGDAGQPGHRLLGGGARSRGAAWAAPPGIAGPMPAIACRHRRSRRAMPGTSKA